MRNLVLTLSSVVAVVTVLVSLSHGQPPRPVTPSYIRLGVGPHEEPAVNAELPVLRHDVEHYYDRESDRLMSYEEIDYEDGSATTKIAPHRSELDLQLAPRSADIQPPPCTLIVESAIVSGNPATGTCHADASVLCRNNGGLQSCSKVGYSLGIYQLQGNGLWTRINYKPGESPTNLLCNGRVTPWVDAGVGAPGTFRFRWNGWNVGTGASLWDLTTQIDYAG